MPKQSRRAVLVEDGVPARVRKPGDLGRLIAVLVVVALLVVLGVLAPDATNGASKDLTRLVRHLPRAITHVLSFVAGLVLLVLPLGFLADLIVRRQARRLLEALGAGVVALVVASAVSAAISAAPDSALYHSLTLRNSAGVATAPLDSYLAAVVAFATVGGMTGNTRWRRYLVPALTIYFMSALVGSQASVLALALSFFLAMAIGIATRYLLGTSTDWPSGQRLVEALFERGIPLTELRYLPDGGDAFRRYLGVTSSGHRLDIHVLDRDLVPSGTLYRLYRMVRVRPEATRGPELSLERIGERRSLLSLEARRAGVPTPELIAGVPCGPDAIVLAYGALEGWPVSERANELTDAQLDEFWRAICRLHKLRVTHRGLTPERISVDRSGLIWVASPTDGTFFASMLRVELDRADLLVTTARLVGAPRAVEIARRVVGQEGLTALVPVLQPIALGRENRLAARGDRQLLIALREEIHVTTAAPPVEPAELERVRPRTVLMLVGLIIAGYLLVGQLGTVNLATVFRSVAWGWVPGVIAGSALTFVAAALALTGYVRERLSFVHTVLAQLAASFAGFVTPPAVGGVAVNVRYLQKSELSATAAGTSVAVNQLVNAISHALLLILFAAASGTAAAHSLPIPGWAFVVLGVVAVGVLVVLAIPQGRQWALQRIMPTLREAGPRLLDLATDPIKLTQVVVGTLLLSGAYIVALWSAVMAFGGDVPFATVAVVYLAGGAIGSAAPTPGGLGAVEAALSTGLAAAGMPGAAAVSAVLLFRLATFWLPVPIGWLSLAWLQSRDAL